MRTLRRRPQALNVSFGGKALTQDSSNGYATGR